MLCGEPPTTGRAILFSLGVVTHKGLEYFLQAKERQESPFFATLSDIGEMFFCYALSLLGLFWAEIEYVAANKPQTYINRIRPAFFAFLSLYAVVQFVCWVLLFKLDNESAKINLANSILDLVVYAAGTIFTLWYACLVMCRVRRTHSNRIARRKKLVELSVVSLTCLYFYVFHTLTTFLYMFHHSVRNFGFAKIVLVALFGEVAPALALLFVLRHVPQPPRHALTQPINTPVQPLLRHRYNTFL